MSFFGETLARQHEATMNAPDGIFQAGQATLVAGTVTVATATITANSIVLVSLDTPGAGASGTRYKVDALVVGDPGSFDITSVDSLAGDNIVNTDVSVINWIVIG